MTPTDTVVLQEELEQFRNLVPDVVTITAAEYAEFLKHIKEAEDE